MNEDKRERLKGYGVVCRTQEQADKMVEFVGDMFCGYRDYDPDGCNTLQYSNYDKNFKFYDSGVDDDDEEDFNHLGNKTYEEACAMCGICEVRPSFENPVEMVVSDFVDLRYSRNRKVVKLLENGGCVGIIRDCDGSNASHYNYYPSCKPIEQEPPKPKTRYMTALEVIQQHTDKCVYRGENDDVFTCFNSSWIVKNRQVCRDKTQPIEDWKWEELMTEDV